MNIGRLPGMGERVHALCSCPHATPHQHRPSVTLLALLQPWAPGHILMVSVLPLSTYRTLHMHTCDLFITFIHHGRCSQAAVALVQQEVAVMALMRVAPGAAVSSPVAPVPVPVAHTMAVH